MDSFGEVVTNLTTNIESLMEKHKEEIQNGKDLKGENQRLTNEVQNHRDELIQLKEKNKALRIAGSVGKDETKDVKLRINELVREIDKCIAQLNK